MNDPVQSPPEFPCLLMCDGYQVFVRKLDENNGVQFSKLFQHSSVCMGIKLLSYRVIHKPCGDERGGFQMSILLHKPYLLFSKKGSQRGRVSNMFKKVSTWFMNGPYIEMNWISIYILMIKGASINHVDSEGGRGGS